MENPPSNNGSNGYNEGPREQLRRALEEQASQRAAEREMRRIEAEMMELESDEDNLQVAVVVKMCPFGSGMLVDASHLVMEFTTPELNSAGIELVINKVKSAAEVMAAEMLEFCLREQDENPAPTQEEDDDGYDDISGLG